MGSKTDKLCSKLNFWQVWTATPPVSFLFLVLFHWLIIIQIIIYTIFILLSYLSGFILLSYLSGFSMGPATVNSNLQSNSVGQSVLLIGESVCFKSSIGWWVSLYSYLNSDSECKFQWVSRFPIGVATVNSMSRWVSLFSNLE